ncbi:aspartyl/asparaginyl beta-hydroxylase, partial [Ixodes scapularis]|uniref:aspartyl/asparaginyl beta-hydroxylase n=1 Tax=Ixodes scapularis TaxID=6945 RepID=UPI001A9D199B
FVIATMSDREVRARKKRKGALEKGAAELPSTPGKSSSHKHSDSELEDDSASTSEPSATAKVTFLIIFVALAITVGAVVIALRSAAPTIEIADETVLDDIQESIIFPQDEHELESENYATERDKSNDLQQSIENSNGNGDKRNFNTDSTQELQSSQHIVLETTSADTPHYFDTTQPGDGTEVTSEHTEEIAQSTGEPEVPSSTESVTLAQTAPLKQEETAQGASQDATSASEGSPPLSDMPTSTLETMQVKPDFPEEESAITNEYDEKIQDDLRDSEELLEKFPERALQRFKEILQAHPLSPRASYGKAQALEKLAELKKSNAMLEQAIQAYAEVMKLPQVPDELYLKAGNRSVDRMRFRGMLTRALKLQSEMSAKFPKNVGIKNEMAVSFLMIGRGQQAAELLEQVLKQDGNSGFAKVHYGFILKTERNDLPGAIKYMSEGIATREPGVIDGRFYFHLGDALARTGQSKKALSIYKEGVKEGLFYSVYQRSLYNVDGLKAQPWWDAKETSYAAAIRELERNWVDIKNEALSLMNDKGFQPESENLRDSGDWKQFEIYARGRRIEKNCRLAPKTCALIARMPDAAGCKRGQVKFSLMHPGTHVWAHTGPTNCRLRAHLGLVVPPRVRIRVANETREWKEGKVLVFDDSFEHEVWHEGDRFRLVLIVDFWHPELTAAQKASLSPI